MLSDEGPVAHQILATNPPVRAEPFVDLLRCFLVLLRAPVHLRCHLTRPGFTDKSLSDVFDVHHLRWAPLSLCGHQPSRHGLQHAIHRGISGSLSNRRGGRTPFVVDTEFLLTCLVQVEFA